MIHFSHAASIGLTCLASGDFAGSTVNVSHYFPDLATRDSDPGNLIVSDKDIEYPVGSYPEVNSFWSVDITSNQVLISGDAPTVNFTDASFNGLVLEVVDGPSLIGASINSSSTCSPVQLTSSVNTVALNFAGLTCLGPSISVIIDIDIESCPTDVNQDGQTDFSDVLFVLSFWGSSTPDADLNQDGEVGFEDLLLLLTSWGPCSG